MRDNLNDALALAQLWPVFPLHTVDSSVCDCREVCSNPGKHPRTMNGFLGASQNVGQVNRWWGMWPTANIGVATGEESGPQGLVVVDIDPAHDGEESLRPLVVEHGVLPYGPRTWTGGGGQHLLFAYPKGKQKRVRSANGVLPGIDVKAGDAQGGGGYIIVPPSVHASGASYCWQEQCSPWEAAGYTTDGLWLPEMPDWLLELVTTAQRHPVTVTGEIQRYPEGQRRPELLRLFGSMRRQGNPYKVLLAAGLAKSLEQFDPPLDEREIIELALDASRRWEPEPDIPIIIDMPPKRNGKREPVVPQTISLAALQLEELPPAKIIVKGLMPVGLALLAGRLKLGKSWMMMGVGIAIALGHLALGTIPVEEGDVLYIAYEDPKRRVKGRTQTLLGDTKWPKRMEVAPSGHWPRRDDGGLDAIDVWLGNHPRARMVVVDTLQRFRGGDAGESDKNAYAADYQVSSELQELALKHEVVIVAVHHFRKSLSDIDWVDQISGTNGIAGAADTLMGFTRRRGEQTAILMVTGRDVDEQELALAFDAEQYGWFISGTAEDLRLTEEGKEFTEALWKEGLGQPVHYRKIAENIGKKKNTVHKMAERLEIAGIVRNLGGGVYVRVHAVQTPDSEAKTVDSNVDRAWTGVSTQLEEINGRGQGVHALSTPLSTLFESEQASLDSVDSNATNRVLPAPPEQACETCGVVAWVWLASGGWGCGRCRPAVKEVE